MKSYKRIRIFTERDLRATRLEMAVIDTRVMQRLRDVKQLGQSFVAFPTAEHSRFSHALGALYWSTKMLAYLKENYFAKSSNTELLNQANQTFMRTVLKGYVKEETFEGITWFEQLVRLAALLHDVSHLPYGHTLEDQAGLLPRHDEDLARIEWIFAALNAEVKDSPHLRGEGGDASQKVLGLLLQQCKALYAVGIVLKEPIQLVKTETEDLQKETEEEKEQKALKAQLRQQLDQRFLPYLVLAYDIVNNTICADLFDYLQRDTLNCGMPWTLDKALFSHLKIVTKPKPDSRFLRLGIAVGRSGKLRHDVITAVLGLLRARYDVTEKVYYHHTKCAADAMLEKAIRTGGIKLDWKTILEGDLGDEGLLHELETRFSDQPGPLSILKALRSRRFHKPIYRIRKAADWSSITHLRVAESELAANRSQFETEISGKCKIPPEAVIVSCLPRRMQLKEAHALVEWTDGEVLTLAELPEQKHYLPEVNNLRDRYLDLWSLTVYLDEAFENYAASVASACERLFDRRNDHLMAEYIKIRYPKAFEVREQLDDFLEQTEVEVVQDLNVAFEGGSPGSEPDVKEVIIDKIERRATRMKKSFKPNKKEKDKSATTPLLGEDDEKVQ